MYSTTYFGKRPPPEKQLSVVLREQLVDSIQNSNLFFASRVSILDTILNATPENVPRKDLKAIVHDWNGQFDVSIIAPSLQRELKKDDIVAFGVNASQDQDGAIQVQGAALRLACTNGAVNRVCDNRRHRIRRPTNQPSRQQELLRRITFFTKEAWSQWSHHADGLVKLNSIILGQDQIAALRSRLRQAPFFLSLRIVNQVLERLQAEIDEQDGPLTLFTLWNAMTFVGTHQRQLSHTYRLRLRLGAGEFTRHQSRVCDACRQLLLS